MIFSDKSEACALCERPFCQRNGINANFILVSGVRGFLFQEGNEFSHEFFHEDMVVAVEREVGDP